MPIRNRHRVGDYLMVDDESGFVHYRSEMVERWDGLWVRKDQYETRNPQEFVRAKADPRALVDVRPEEEVGAVCLFTHPFIGNTDVLRPGNDFTNFAGIGDMTITNGTTSAASCGPFIVYGDNQV